MKKEQGDNFKYNTTMFIHSKESCKAFIKEKMMQFRLEAK